MGLGDSLKFTAGIDFSAANRQLSSFATQSASTLRGLNVSAAAVGATMAAGFTAGALALKSILDAGATMEDFTLRLTTIMGSATDAKARMSELFDFAATTKFEVGQIVGADVTLRGFGADMDALFPKLIAFSSAFGTDLAQSAIDFGKAWNQGGAGLESDTGKILKSMIEATAGIKTADMSIEEFRTNMLKTLDDPRFAAGMVAASKTFSGIMGNLSDEWTRFKLAIADAGLFNNVKAAATILLETIGDSRSEAGMLAETISTGIWEGLKLAAQAAAMVWDALVGAKMVLAVAAATAWGFAAALAEAGAVFARGFAGSGDLVASLDAAAVRARGYAADSWDTVAAIAGQKTALDTVTEALIEAEKRAAGFAAAGGFEGGVAKGAPTTAGGEGDTAAADAFTAKFEAALDFTEDMRALDDTELQREQMQYGARLAELQSYEDQGLIAHAYAAEARKAIEADYQKYIDDLREESAEKEKERQREIRDVSLSSLASALGSVASMLDEANAEQKAAAKVLAAGQITISGIAAQAKAWEAGWPAGLALSIAAGAQTAAQFVALASAHQGHAGDTVYAHQGAAPDERDTRMLRSESVLNSQATRALGAQGIEALNSGGVGRQEIVVNLGRTQTREVQREDIRSNGPMSRRMRERMGTAGRGRDVGFTGRTAFA